MDHIIKCDKPSVIIIEQPMERGTRFRYESESKYVGHIIGKNSTSKRKTYPSIQILNYSGQAVLLVSCVTKNQPYLPHPYKLIGTNTSNGFYCASISDSQKEVVLNQCGIQIVKKKEMELSLTEREKNKIDPFKTGFSHKTNPEKIDTTCVRLCFQVFIKGQDGDYFNIPLKPIVSDPIYDKKSSGKPTIRFLSHYSAPVSGGTHMILLCEKMSKDDIIVKFFNAENGWNAIATLTEPFQHKNVALIIKTPKYCTQNVDEPVKVQIQLERPSDGEKSGPVPFLLTPISDDNLECLRRKRMKIRESSSSLISIRLQEEVKRSSLSYSVNSELKVQQEKDKTIKHFDNFSTLKPSWNTFIRQENLSLQPTIFTSEQTQRNYSHKTVPEPMNNNDNAKPLWNTYYYKENTPLQSNILTPERIQQNHIHRMTLDSISNNNFDKLSHNAYGCENNSFVQTNILTQERIQQNYVNKITPEPISNYDFVKPSWNTFESKKMAPPQRNILIPERMQNNYIQRMTPDPISHDNFDPYVAIGDVLNDELLNKANYQNSFCSIDEIEDFLKAS